MMSAAVAFDWLRACVWTSCKRRYEDRFRPAGRQPRARGRLQGRLHVREPVGRARPRCDGGPTGRMGPPGGGEGAPAEAPAVAADAPRPDPCRPMDETG